MFYFLFPNVKIDIDDKFNNQIDFTSSFKLFYFKKSEILSIFLFKRFGKKSKAFIKKNFKISNINFIIKGYENNIQNYNLDFIKDIQNTTKKKNLKIEKVQNFIIPVDNNHEKFLIFFFLIKYFFLKINFLILECYENCITCS